MWFIDLTVATCHIQYTFLSLCQFVSRENGQNTIRKWPPTVTRRAKHSYWESFFEKNVSSSVSNVVEVWHKPFHCPLLDIMHLVNCSLQSLFLPLPAGSICALQVPPDSKTSLVFCRLSTRLLRVSEIPAWQSRRRRQNVVCQHWRTAAEITNARGKNVCR